MRAKKGMFGLPPHSTIETASRSASWPSVRKTKGKTSFSVRPSTSSAARARKSSLRSASSSLSARKLSSAGSGCGWKSPCRPAAVLDERELLEPRDVEERRGVGRVDHMAAGRGEVAQQPVEVALRLGSQEELDQEDNARNAGGTAGFEAVEESERGSCGRSSAGAGSCGEELDHPARRSGRGCRGGDDRVSAARQAGTAPAVARLSGPAAATGDSRTRAPDRRTMPRRGDDRRRARGSRPPPAAALEPRAAARSPRARSISRSRLRRRGRRRDPERS